jgi:septal ring factor EnvC (AmiA/AmiB activator)
MKTYSQFQENVSELRGQLQSIERQDAPAQRLAARRKAAETDRSNQIQANKDKVAEYQAAQKEKLAN